MFFCFNNSKWVGDGRFEFSIVFEFVWKLVSEFSVVGVLFMVGLFVFCVE